MGKSFTVEALVQMLQDKGRPVAVTASTGTAALNVNGMTIHRLGTFAAVRLCTLGLLQPAVTQLASCAVTLVDSGLTNCRRACV